MVAFVAQSQLARGESQRRGSVALSARVHRVEPHKGQYVEHNRCDWFGPRGGLNVGAASAPLWLLSHLDKVECCHVSNSDFKTHQRRRAERLPLSRTQANTGPAASLSPLNISFKEISFSISQTHAYGLTKTPNNPFSLCARTRFIF